MRKESVEESLKAKQTTQLKDDEGGLLKGIQDFMKQHLASVDQSTEKK